MTCQTLPHLPSSRMRRQVHRRSTLRRGTTQGEHLISRPAPTLASPVQTRGDRYCPNTIPTLRPIPSQVAALPRTARHRQPYRQTLHHAPDATLSSPTILRLSAAPIAARRWRPVTNRPMPQTVGAVSCQKQIDTITLVPMRLVCLCRLCVMHLRLQPSILPTQDLLFRRWALMCRIGRREMSLRSVTPAFRSSKTPALPAAAAAVAPKDRCVMSGVCRHRPHTPPLRNATVGLATDSQRPSRLLLLLLQLLCARG